jgi:poly-beta-1,6-N-acetyl-D-glucosamine biosynthesis protein PgaD
MNKENHSSKHSWIININSRRKRWAVSLEWLVSIALTLLLWVVLYKEIVSQLLGRKLQQTLEMLSFLFVVSLIIFIVMGGWQFYNWYRFHGKDRRKAFKQQPLSEVAALYGMSENDMKIIQGNFRQASVQYQYGRYWYVLPDEQSVEIKSLREK